MADTLKITSAWLIVNQQWLHLSVPEAFVAQNHSLDYLRGTLGFSYMCRERQTLGVTPDFAINTFQVQVQPFGVTGKQFAAGKFWLDEAENDHINRLTVVWNLGCFFLCLPAEECQLDKDDMLIPIIVGAALAALVLIVLSAYLIGRKRSHAGYQSIWGPSSPLGSPRASVHCPTLEINHCLMRLNTPCPHPLCSVLCPHQQHWPLVDVTLKLWYILLFKKKKGNGLEMTELNKYHYMYNKGWY